MTAAKQSSSPDGERVAEVGSLPRTALIIDYAGVLTVPLSEALTHWMVADGLDAERFPAFMREFIARSIHDEDGPVHGLEIGTWSAEQFEHAFARKIADAGVGTVAAPGLLARMFSGLRPDNVMVDAVARIHAAGVRTALLSNAFGFEYPRDGWSKLFDATVISDEVGIRKPDLRIYRLACERLRVDPSSAVYVDDFEANVAAATGLGMTGIHHISAATTIPQLAGLLELDEREFGA
jgi:putative hydrolase of the HAD superfamily